MPSRRRLLKGLVGAGTVAALPGCGSSSLINMAESPPPGALPNNGLPLDFDYPTVTTAPFAHGVASGDPLADRVIIWTRITQAIPTASMIPVWWRIARDPAMRDVVRDGMQGCTAEHDWTVKVDVTGLAPATTYYYRFEALGARSMIGRTRTAPAAMAEQIRFAYLSCMSYWSSHWSGLGHIADRHDLDLVVHSGDYVYEFVDEDEEVRARNDRFTTGDVDYRCWRNLAEVRRRYALWRSDAQLARAHQQHPWFIVWDNHDINPNYSNELPTPFDGLPVDTTLDDTCRAFWEWTPSRPPRGDGSGEFMLVNDGQYPVPENVRLVYRRLPYGELAEFVGVDTQIGLPRYGLMLDSSHLDEGATLYGRPQFEWLTQTLLSAEQRGVRHKIVNNQTLMTPVDLPDIVEGVPLPKLGISRWTDYAAERRALVSWLGGNNSAATRIRGTVLMSGDIHGNFAADLVGENALLSGYVSGVPIPSVRPGSHPRQSGGGLPAAWHGQSGAGQSSGQFSGRGAVPFINGPGRRRRDYG